MSESPPFSLELFAVSQSLGRGFVSDVLRNVEPSDSSVDLVVSFSSSGLEDPVVRMEAGFK